MVFVSPFTNTRGTQTGRTPILFGPQASNPFGPRTKEEKKKEEKRNIFKATERVFQADFLRSKPEGSTSLREQFFPKKQLKGKSKEQINDMVFSKLVDKKQKFANRSAVGEGTARFAQEAIGESADSIAGFLTGDRGGKRGLFNQTIAEQVEILEDYLKDNDPERFEKARMMDVQGESPVARAIGGFAGEVAPGLLVGAQFGAVFKALPFMQKLSQGGRFAKLAHVQLRAAAQEITALGTFAFKDDRDAGEWMKEVAASPSLAVPLMMVHTPLPAGLTRNFASSIVGGLADYYTGKAVGMDDTEALVNGFAGAFGASVDTRQLGKTDVGIFRKGMKEMRGAAIDEADKLRQVMEGGDVDAKTAKKMMDESQKMLQEKAKSLGLVGGEEGTDKALSLFRKQSKKAVAEAGEAVPKKGIPVVGKAGPTEVPGRDLKEEVTKRVTKQNEGLADEVVVKLREENLLQPEDVDEIILRKRGVISDKEAVKRAKSIKVTEEEILNLPRGTALSKEQHTAVRQFVAQEREINKQLRAMKDAIVTGAEGQVPISRQERGLLERAMGKTAFDPTLSDEQLLNAAIAEQTRKMRKMEIIDLAVGSEAGRALQGLKQDVAAVDARMRSIFQRMKGKTDLEQDSIIEALGDVDIENPKEFIKFLETIDNPDLFDKAAEWIVSVKLWNPTTHAVNFGSNFVRQAADIITTGVSDPKRIFADLQGAKVGLGRGLKRAFRAMTDEGYAQDLSKFIETGGRAPAFKGRVGKVVRAPFVALSAGDELFKGIAFERSMYRQAATLSKGDRATMKQLLEQPTFEMMEEASEQAKRMTFQEDMGEIMRSINSFRDPSRFKSIRGKSFAVGMRAFLPFIKTPTNLVRQSAHFSPLGLFISIADRSLSAPERRKRIAEAALGSALMSWTYSEVLEGNITGGAPTEAKARDQFFREGKLPYSIKVDGKWIQYKRVDPLATLIGLVGDLQNIEDPRKIGAYWHIFTEQLRDKTFLQGASDLVDLFSDKEWEVERVRKNLITGNTIPSFIGHTARALDPTLRDTKEGGAKAAFQSLLPGASEGLPPRVDVFGNTIERANKGLNYFFNPVQTTDDPIDPVTDELTNIDYLISLPKRNFTRDGNKIEFTPEEYAQFSQEAGQEMYRRMEILIKLPQYKRQTLEEKHDSFESVRTDVMTEFKDKFLEQKIKSGEISGKLFDKRRKPRNTSRGVARDVLIKAKSRGSPRKTKTSSIFLPPR